MQNLREKEIQILGKMLSLNTTAATSTAVVDFHDQWKVLIYDAEGRDIISPLLNVGGLRQKGVTLHLMLHSEREAVADAPAVYFIKPTEANLKRVAEDCSKQLYRSVYLNFITRIDRNLLEKFAQDLVNYNSVHQVTKIFDQYLDVIALEPNLFTLNIKDSFALYNEPSLNETQIRSFMNRVALGLLSAVRVMGTLPVIRAPPGGAAEMLAHELNAILKDNISARGPAQALFEDCLVHDRSRPLMLIMDRSSDLFPLLQHNSTYQALISELLDFKLNRVTVDVPEKNSTASKKKTYDLNTQLDSFLYRYAAAPFPEAVDASEKELSEVSQRESAIRSRPDFAKLAANGGADLMTGDGGLSNLEDKGRDLSEAIESLPEILLKKANLETHTNIMQSLMKKIATREIPTYFELEQTILAANGRIDRAAVLALLKDPAKGDMLDKARLLAITAVMSDPSSQTKAMNDELDASFQQGCSAMTASVGSSGDGQAAAAGGTVTLEEVNKLLAVIAFIRRLLSLQAGSSSFLSGGGLGGLGGGGGATSNALFQSFLSSAQSRATSLIAKAATFFTKFTPHHITRVTHLLAEGRGSSTEEESYILLDPKAMTAPTSAGSGGYSEVIVFVLGGGCYSEYYNLQESLKDKVTNNVGQLRHITYGCTDVLSGDEFMKQILVMLANSSSSSTAAAAVKG